MIDIYTLHFIFPSLVEFMSRGDSKAGNDASISKDSIARAV